MERELIESKVQEIPLSELGMVASDEEIWEECDGDARFMVTRHILPALENPEFLSLSVSGPPAERRRIIGEFIEVFGTPTSSDQDFTLPDHIDLAAWLIQHPTH